MNPNRSKCRGIIPIKYVTLYFHGIINFFMQTSFQRNIYVAFISKGDTITFIAKCVPKGALSRFHIAKLKYVDIQHYHEVDMLQVTYYTLNAK